MKTQDFSKFQFIADALNAQGGFAPVFRDYETPAPLPVSGSYLIRFAREAADKYGRRQRASLYRNFLKSACSRFLGYLSSKQVERDIGSSLLEPIALDADWRGNSIDVFWHEFMISAKARGTMLVLVDMPQDLPINRGDQIEQRAVPFFTAIAPETIADYEMNDRGRFAWVALLTTWNNSPAWKVWTETGWKITSTGRNGYAYVSGEHNLGVCPVLIFTESGGFPCYGEFSQIAELSKKWFNRYSELDEALSGQAFAILTLKESMPPMPGGDVKAEVIGTSNLFKYAEERPEFIAPPTGAMEIHLKALSELETAMRDIAYTIELTGQAESAAALNLRFQNLNSALSLFARRMEDFERQVWDVACRWLGIANATQISWPQNYLLADLSMELQNLQMMQSSNFPSEIVAEQMKRIVTIQFGSAEKSALEKMLTTIDARQSEV